jgi:hypothetical protein
MRMSSSILGVVASTREIGSAKENFHDVAQDRSGLRCQSAKSIYTSANADLSATLATV